jgi:anhydro-N-acetylmuramic acid kinase
MRQTKDLYIGLMSGTSVDAVDAVLVRIGTKLELRASLNFDIPTDLKNQIHEVCTAEHVSMDDLGRLNRQMGDLFADATLTLLSRVGVSAKEICAIGSHGQTIRHRPPSASEPSPFTWQIGDPHVITARTEITTVADFRSRDLAEGGHGAPLAPLFHLALCHNLTESCGVLNIGGLANLTVIDQDQVRHGFDTGPGNTLIDAWYRHHNTGDFDKGGSWACTGAIDLKLLKQWLNDPYFSKAPPKSTGREYFNSNWVVAQSPHVETLPPADVAATLVELTAVSAGRSIRESLRKNQSVYVCGGGAHNTFLLSRLQNQLPNNTLENIEKLGIGPDWIEAAAFAWLAHARLQDQRFDLSRITGSKGQVPLGVIYPA